MNSNAFKGRSLLGGLVLAGLMALAPVASATMVTIDNIMVPLGQGSMAANLYETTVSQVGDELSGFGQVTTIYGTPGNGLNFCGSGSCQLTYQFGGYTVDSLTATQATFSGGWVNFYSTNSYTATYASAGTGNLWLTLTGSPFAAILSDGTVSAVTLYANGQQLGTGSDTGAGQGHLNVTYSAPVGVGSANWLFNTDSFSNDPYNLLGLNTFADFLFTSGFTGLATGVPGYPVSGSATLSYLAVPEPSGLGMMGFGLLAVGLLGLRFRQARYRRR